MSLPAIDHLLTASGRAALDAAASHVRRQAHGRVYEVDELDECSGEYDSIVSILAIAAAADPLDLILSLRERLAPGGRLHFLEPIGSSGTVARLKAGLVSPVVAQTGVALDRAIPNLLRAAGFTVVDIQRLRPTTRIPMPGPFARGTARIRPDYAE